MPYAITFRRAGQGLCLLLLFHAFSAAGLAAQDQDEDRQMAMAEAVEHALEQSKLTVAGGTPFHLKAHIAAEGNASAGYSAEVEEYWAGPEKWRRMVSSEGFSQTLVVNGGRIREKLNGDYYPFWLHDLVTAIFDPLPMAEQLKRMRTTVAVPQDSTSSRACVNMQSRVGVAPAQNTVEYAFCFGGKLGLLNAAITPGYRARFAGYQPFKNKLVARTISAELAPGLIITAKITELTELADPDEGLFVVEAPTPAAEQIRSSQVSEDSARILALNTPPVAWPPLREGSTSGVLSLYISTDRSGRVREVWPAGHGDPQLTQAAREQVLRWQYKPYMNAGVSQMEAVLTLEFNTRIENPVPVLKDGEARKLAASIARPALAPGKAPRGTSYTLRVSVDQAGKVQNVLNPNNVAPALWAAGSTALRKWRFRPYIHQGKPDRFYADITFVAP